MQCKLLLIKASSKCMYLMHIRKVSHSYYSVKVLIYAKSKSKLV